MRRDQSLPLLLSCLAIGLLSYRNECSARTATDNSDFHLPHFPPGRTLDTMFTIDLDGRRKKEYVVMSHADDGPYGTNRTRIQVFAYDTPAHVFRVVQSASAFRIDSLEVRDLTGDGKPEVVALLDDGGNDEVVTMGMVIFSGHGGTIRTIFRSHHGHPQLTSLSTGRPAVLYYEKLGRPYIAHVFSREYLCDIFAFRNNTFGSVKSRYPKMFLSEAKNYLDEYRSVLDSSEVSDTAQGDSLLDRSWTDVRIPDGLDILIPVTLVMTSYRLAGARRSLDAFWNSERAFLRRRLSKDYFDYVAEVHAGRLHFHRRDLCPEIPRPGSRQPSVLP